MEGNVQIRIEKPKTETHHAVDFWLGNLRKGSCFNVYTPFQSDRKARVTYYANS